MPAKCSILYSHSLKVTLSDILRLTLVADLWIQWLDDEESAATDDAAVMAIYKLYDRAVADYLCMHPPQVIH